MRAIRKKFKKRRIIIPIIILIVISCLVWFFINANQQSVDVASNKPAGSNDSINKDKVVHVAAMGDMLAHDTIIANAKNGNDYDFAKYFNNIRPSYQNADIVFCNQEGLSAGEQYGISGYPSFNAPFKYASDLQSGAGCNLINLANNHMGDKGVAATNATIDEWSKLGPLGIGGANKNLESQEKVSLFEVNGIRIGFVAFADFNNNKLTPGYSVNNYHDTALVRRLIASAKSNSDVVIASMHWGDEDSGVVNNDQQSEANLLSSLGVDIILGTGPHVLQKAQSITRADENKTIVFYSLGNMLSSQLLIKELIGGIAQFNITKNVSGKISITNLAFVPTYMHYEWTADQAKNGDLLARKNVMIYLLKDAAGPLSRSLLGTTVDAQRQYVIDTIGPEVIVQ